MILHRSLSLVLENNNELFTEHEFHYSLAALLLLEKELHKIEYDFSM